MYRQCSLYIPSVVTICTASGHYMYRQWSLNVPPVVTICTVSVHYIYRQWSLYVPSVVTICTASGHYMYRQWSLYVPPHSAHTAVFICFVWILEQTAIISLYCINWLVCIRVFTVRYGLYVHILIIPCCSISVTINPCSTVTPLHACSSPSPFRPPVRPSLVISAKGRVGGGGSAVPKTRSWRTLLTAWYVAPKNCSFLRLETIPVTFKELASQTANASWYSADNAFHTRS